MKGFLELLCSSPLVLWQLIALIGWVVALGLLIGTIGEWLLGCIESTKSTSRPPSRANLSHEELAPYLLAKMFVCLSIATQSVLGMGEEEYLQYLMEKSGATPRILAAAVNDVIKELS